MSSALRWLRNGLPIAVLLFLWVSMRTVSGYPLSSGTGFAESMTAFGFPLSWHAASASTSNAYKIAVVPLLVDLLVYALAVVALQWLVADRLARAVPISSRAMLALSALLWVAAALSLAAALIVVMPNVQVSLSAVNVYFNGEGAMHLRSIAFGFLPQER